MLDEASTAPRAYSIERRQISSSFGPNEVLCDACLDSIRFDSIRFEHEHEHEHVKVKVKVKVKVNDICDWMQ